MAGRSTKKSRAAVASPARTVLDLAEEAEDRFDEACEHALRRPGNEGITLGPSLSLPMGRLRPGRLAWSREVRATGGSAQLVYVLDPTPGGSATPEFPLLDVAPREVLVDVRAPAASPVRLLGLGDPTRAPKSLRSFVRAVQAELASDSE